MGVVAVAVGVAVAVAVGFLLAGGFRIGIAVS